MKSLLIGSALSFVASTSYAASFTERLNLNSFDNVYGESTTTAPGFPSNLGTITALDVNGSFSVNDKLPVIPPQGVNPTKALFDVKLSVRFPNPVAQVFTAPTQVATGQIGLSSGQYSATVSDSFIFDVSVPYSSYYDPPTFVVDELAVADPSSGILGQGDNEAFVGGGTLALTYTYTPVPEPTSVGLLAIPAFALLAGVRRRG